MKQIICFSQKEHEADEYGPPSMAPPPLPPDYSGKQSDAAQNDMMDMGWSMPTQPQAQPNQTASNTDDDWGNTGWGLPGNSTAVNKPVENNFAQAGGNHHSSGFNNDFSASNQPNTAANTNQVTFLKPCVVLLLLTQ